MKIAIHWINGVKKHISKLPHFFIPILIIVIGSWFSFYQYHQVKQRNQQVIADRFAISFNEITQSITEKVRSYEQMLRATQGLFESSKIITRSEFRNYAEKLRLEAFYPGIQGLGYVPLITPEEKSAHIEMVRQSGFPDYSIYPEGERQVYTSILYLEPFETRNLRAFGFDMYSETTRRAAMMEALQSGNTALSGGVKLVQDNPEEPVTGLLMYLPLFESNASEKIHTGWVYAVFRINDVINASLTQNGIFSHMQITDVTDGTQDVLFQSSQFQTNPFELSETYTLAGRQWKVTAYPDKAFIKAFEKQSATALFFLELLMTFLIAFIFWLLASGRVRAENRANEITQSLKEKHLKLQLATDTAGMGTWEWNFQRQIVLVDEHQLSIFGEKEHANQSLSLEDWFSRFEETDRQRVEMAFERSKANGDDLNIQALVQAGNETRMVQLKTTINFEASGLATGMIGICFDITDSWLYQTQLEQTEARWKHALEGSGEGVWDWSIIDDKVLFSEKLISMLGYTPDEFSPHVSEWSDRIHPDDRQQVFSDIDALLDGSQPEYRNEHRMLCKDGSWKWILDRGTVIERDEQGNPLRAIGTHTDISGRKSIEINLRISEERFRNAFDTAAIGMALVGLDGSWLEANPACCEMLGYSEGELLQMTFMDVTHPEDLDVDKHFVDQLIAGEIDHYQMEKRYICRNHQLIDVLLSVSVVHDINGDLLHFVSQIEDITARKHEHELMRKMALYDALTGLPNRRLFDERMNQAILGAKRNKHPLALMFIDVDHFKQINDTYGHDIGDQVIKRVAETMLSALRATDTLARFGGDEFVVLLNKVSSPEAAVKVAEHLRKSLENHLVFGDIRLLITLSIGIAAYLPETNETPLQLMKKADMALYDVKARGRDGVGIFQTGGFEK
mgnify:FL=1|jgi:diguanylate cyclase (GGDEF)-like protein/PAS domain S-box-containing protein